MSENATPPAEAVRSDDHNLYDAGYYGNYEGAPYEKGGHWTRFFGAIADEVIARFNPKVTLDAGCALGVFVSELRQRGVEAWGVDLSEFAISQADDQAAPYVRVGSLTAPLPEGFPAKFDLISCIEVLEHMDVAAGDDAIGRLCAVTDRILFASTPDGFAEATHFACRTPEEWSAVFARHGFFRDFDASATFLAPWAVVYTRQDLTTYEAVARYDRRFARLADENRQLRERVIAMEKQLTEATDHESEPGMLRKEILSLRDELHAASGERERLKAEIQELHSLAATAVAARERELMAERGGASEALRKVLRTKPARAIIDPIRRLQRGSGEGRARGSE